MSTFIPSAHQIDRKWFVVDASGKTLGRLATEAASVLSGKRNPKYVPYIDMGDHVVVINAEKVRLTGLKSQQKLYRRYTGFPGGLREESFTRLIERRPEKIVEEAIKGGVQAAVEAIKARVFAWREACVAGDGIEAGGAQGGVDPLEEL